MRSIALLSEFGAVVGAAMPAIRAHVLRAIRLTVIAGLGDDSGCRDVMKLER